MIHYYEKNTCTCTMRSNVTGEEDYQRRLSKLCYFTTTCFLPLIKDMRLYEIYPYHFMQFCGQLNMTWWFWRRFLNGLNVRLSLSLSEGNENEDSFLAHIKTDRQTDGR